MSQLVEILGRALTVDVAEVIWKWLDTIKLPFTETSPRQAEQLTDIINLAKANTRTIDKTAEQLKFYLFENPGCPFGHLAAAAINIHEDRPRKAIEELKLVYRNQPSNTIALYALGLCYERLGQEQKAVEFYQDCLKFKKYLQLPRQRLAAVYFKNGRIDHTINQYQQLKSEYPDDLSISLSLGYLYIATEEYEKAIDTFNTAILIHPDNFHDEDDEIEKLIYEGKAQEALEILQQLFENQPERVDLMIRCADILAMLGATNESLEQYQQAVDLCPGCLEAKIKLGTQYMHMEQNLAAAEQFNAAIEINDQIVDAYIGLATAQKLSELATHALTTLSLAAAIQPNTALLYTQAAALRLNLQSDNTLLETAIEAHKQQIEHLPHNPDLYYRLGILFMAANSYKHALSAFQAAVNINPTFSRAKTKITICLFELGRQHRALRRLEKLLCFDKESINLHYRVAMLYCNKIKFAYSLMNLDRLLKENFTTTDPTVNVSIALQNLGILDRAEVMWDNLTDTASQAVNN